MHTVSVSDMRMESQIVNAHDKHSPYDIWTSSRAVIPGKSTNQSSRFTKQRFQVYDHVG